MGGSGLCGRGCPRKDACDKGRMTVCRVTRACRDAGRSFRAIGIGVVELYIN
jgi:hypothetical protein